MKRSLYREYRPQTFSELVGQDHVARTLRNAVETDQVAHAYIFAGPRGTGKTSTARILAKALNCVGADGANDRPTATPCGVCRHCVAIADGVSLDVVEMDAASNRSIDDVRDLRDKIAFAPVDGRFKVYIVDEVHMLTREAFNALLKTLEEPPDNVVFVLATTEAHKIPETIVSRCQRFDFHRPQVTDIVRLLAGIVERENARPEADRGGPVIDIQAEALHIIARHSQGGFRDAIGTLDKLVTYAEGTITAEDVLEALGVTSSDLLFEITDIVIERRTAEALQFVQRLANEGTDYSQFIRDLLRHLRQLFLLQHLGEAASDDATLRTLSQTVELDGELFREQLQRAGQVSPREVVHFIESLGEAQREIRDGLDPRLQLELALVKVTRPELDHSETALEERLRRLEAATAGAGPAPAAPRPAPAKATAARKPTPKPAPPVAAEPPAREPATDAAPASRPATPANAAAPAVPADEAAAETAPDETAAAEPAAPAAEAPADAAPAAEPAQELTVERVKRAWELILQRVQAARVPLYGFLRDGRPTALDGDVLVVSLASEFAARNAAQGDNAQVLADAVEGVLGRRLTARFEVAAGAQAPASAPQTSTAAAPQPPASLPDFTDQIRAAAAKLDAEVLPDDS
jgi:DNA polymerase-3 subunit gamma/tau